MSNAIVNWFSSLFSSVGLKRRIAALAAALLELAKTVPALAPAIPILEYLAGIMGGIGVAHAGSEGTLGKAKLISISSLLSLLVLLAGHVPAAAAFLPLIQKLAALLGMAGLGAAVATKKK